MSKTAESSAESIKGAVGENMPWPIAMLIWIAEMFTKSVTVIIRSDPGARYLSLNATLINSFLMLFVAFMASSWVPHGFGPLAGTSLALFALVSLGFGIYRRYVIWQKERNGDEWHSYFGGNQLPFFQHLPKGNEYLFVSRWYEPLLVIIISMVAGVLSTWLLMYLFVVAIMLKITAEAEYNEIRTQRYDMIDGQIEAKNMEAALAGVSPAKSAGFTLPGIQSLKGKERERMADALRAKVAGGSVSAPAKPTVNALDLDEDEPEQEKQSEEKTAASQRPVGAVPSLIDDEDD